MQSTLKPIFLAQPSKTCCLFRSKSGAIKPWRDVDWERAASRRGEAGYWYKRKKQREVKRREKKRASGPRKERRATRQGTKAETKMKGRKRKTDSALSRVARESGHVAHHIAGEREPRTADIR